MKETHILKNIITATVSAFMLSQAKTKGYSNCAGDHHFSAAEPQQCEVNKEVILPVSLERSQQLNGAKKKRGTDSDGNMEKFMWETNNSQVKSNGERGDSLLLEKLSTCKSRL